MESFAPQQDVLAGQAAVDAGLPLAEIQDLVCRLGFEAVVCDSRSFDARAHGLVGDRPAVVRAAWVETIDRMIGSPRPGAAPGAPPFRPAPPR